MKWRTGKRSPDLRDQRAGGGGGRFPGGGGGGGFPIPTGRLGGGGLVGFIIIVILFFVLRGGGGGGGFDIPDPTAASRRRPRAARATASPRAPTPRPAGRLRLLRPRRHPGLLGAAVPGRREALRARQARPLPDAVNSGCGQASSATGPFYLPARPAGLLDLGFFDELNRRFKAPGDFAQAYVIAHEIGHHLQQQLGIEREVRARARASPTTPTSSRSGSSSRPTASPASGAIHL